MNPETNPTAEEAINPPVPAGDGSDLAAAGGANGPNGGEIEIPSAVPAWNDMPVPDGPDRHDESSSRSLRLPREFSLVGARVRGKKHKHEGTNCDDWFEFAVSGAWTIIAVSDGAGSRPF